MLFAIAKCTETGGAAQVVKYSERQEGKFISQLEIGRPRLEPTALELI